MPQEDLPHAGPSRDAAFEMDRMLNVWLPWTLYSRKVFRL